MKIIIYAECRECGRRVRLPARAPYLCTLHRRIARAKLKNAKEAAKRGVPHARGDEPLCYLGHGTAQITVQPEVGGAEFLILMETAQNEAAMSIAKFVPVDWKIGPNGIKIITATVKVYA